MPIATVYVEPLLRELHQRLIDGESATRLLTDWCKARGFSGNRPLISEPIDGPAQRCSPQQRERLQTVPYQKVAYRRVRLINGQRALCEADNWFLPDRLTPEMNRALASSNEPFGSVIIALRPLRRTIGFERLYEALPAIGARDCVLRHRALVMLPDGTPIAEVDERFLGAVVTDEPD